MRSGLFCRVLPCLLVLAAALAGAGSGRLFAAGWVTGQGRIEKIAGNPSAGYKYLYEWDLFVSAADDSVVGWSRRLGAPPGEPPRADGYYRIDNVPAGTYSVYVSQPDFFASPKVVPGVEVRDGQGTTVDIDLDVDFSTYVFPSASWTDWGWTWYQSFEAGGTSVRGISWIMAGLDDNTPNPEAEVAVLEDNGAGNVKDWLEIGSKTKRGLGRNSDQWVRWPSGQIRLVPGRAYAVRIWVEGGTAIYKRDKDGQSYPFGRAYDQSGKARDFDLNVTVFVDRNNQSVTHTRLEPKPGDFHGQLSDRRWGQSFVATGVALAAVDLFAASGEAGFDLTWRLRRDGPAGPQVGPAKSTRGAYFASSTQLVGVSYNPGEAPLRPGRTYYIEATDTANFTPYVQPGSNAYPDGQAYRDGSPTGYDLSMTIMQYTARPEPKSADLDGSRRVEFRDYALLVPDWGRSGGALRADLDNNFVVDAFDLGQFCLNWLSFTGPHR